MTTLIRSIAYLITDPDTVLRNAELLIEDGRITAVGSAGSAGKKAASGAAGSGAASAFAGAAGTGDEAGSEIIDASGCVVFPGLINAHTHLWQVSLMGRRDDLPLQSWIDKVLTPGLDRLYSVEDGQKRERLCYLMAALGICRMLRSGTTAFLDMDLGLCQEGFFKAAEDAGVRGHFGVELADWYVNEEGNPDAAEALRLLKKYPEAAVLTPTELNYCLDTTLKFAADAAERYGCLVQMHVNETAAEAAQALSERGAHELLYLDRFGLLSDRFSAVHAIHLTDEEIALAAKRGISVVYNPKSNMKLGSGVCPVPKLKEAGIGIALSTDGPASNDRLDMFEEMRTGALLQKAALKDPSVILAKDVFRMATEGGARLLHLNTGHLKEGAEADFCIMPLDRGHILTDGSDMVSTLVYCAQSGDVRDVYVKGRPVLKDHEPCAFDEAALTRELAGELKLLWEE